MRIIDLSHVISQDITVYPGTPQPKIIKIATHNTNGYAELHLTMTTHTGTHLDAPFHILENGKTITDLTAEQFYGQAICIPVEEQVIGKELLNQYDLTNIDFVLFNTGMYKYWNQPSYLKSYPVLTTQAAHHLAQIGLKGVGIDTISVDSIDSQSLEIHKLILSSGAIIIENLTNLDEVCGETFLFSCFPLKIQKADGSPVRAVAIMN